MWVKLVAHGALAPCEMGVQDLLKACVSELQFDSLYPKIIMAVFAQMTVN